MKAIVLLVALLFLMPAPAAARESAGSLVAVTISPGPFTVTLAVDDEVAVLTVDDATGSGRGWWVSLDCTCAWAPAGETRTLAGDAEHGPRWDGATLAAAPDEGMGRYRQILWASEGSWVVTSGQGELP